MPAHDDEFDQIINGFGGRDQPDYPPTSPYGAPAQPHKPGLTRRGKVALGIGAVVLGGGSLIGYQVHASNAAQAEAKAQEIQLKADALELAKLREMNRATEINRKTQTTVEKARQDDIDACVKANASKIGKGLGSPSRRDVVDDCHAQYASTDNSSDMAAAGSATTTGQGGGIDVNSGMVIGVGVIALIVFAASKGRRAHYDT